MGRKGSKTKPRNRRRRILLLVLIGLGIAAARAAQGRAAAPAPLTVVPTPKPPAPAPTDEVTAPDPVEQTETPVAADDLHEAVVTEFIGADGEAAHAHLGDVPPAPADSLTSFFEEVLTESKSAEAAKGAGPSKGESEPT